MLTIQLEVYRDKYKGLDNLVGLFEKSLRYEESEDSYFFETEDYLFYSLLFAIHKHVNNKDNWIFEDYWDDIRLIVDFKSDEFVYIKVYDFYVE